MKTISISGKQKRGVLASVLDKVNKEPVTLQEAGEDIAVVLSPAQFQAFTAIRQTQLDDFFTARARVAASVERNGLTQDALTELLSE